MRQLSAARWKLLAMVLIFSGVLLPVVQRAVRVPLTPETQSAFLKSYRLDEVVARFDVRQGSQRLESSGSQSGYRYAQNTRSLSVMFVMKGKQHETAQAEILKDVTSWLIASGATIVNSERSNDGVTHLRYSSGRAEGVVSIEPLANDYAETTRLHIDDARLVAVRERVSIEEKWMER
jgi:hypothetical protein